MEDDLTSGNHAVIIGASISGLVTARVLSDHVDRVTVIDRDSLPMTSDNRKGVPQGHHGHGLLASGYAGLTHLFPRLEQALLAAGAVPGDVIGDVIGDVRWFQHGHYKAKFHSGFAGILLSRPLLEGTLRQQARELPNVTLVDDTHVTGLITDSQRRRVTGVRIHRAGCASSVLDADLVVDAGGRASRSPEWLEMFGYTAPSADVVDVGLGYTTRTFRRRPHDLNGDIGASLLVRYAATNENFVLGVCPHNGLGARSAPKKQREPAKGLTGISRAAPLAGS